MVQAEDVLKFLLDHSRKIFYPQEWINLDLSLSKTEILCLLWMSWNEEVIMREVAEYLDIPLSTTTGVINRLVKNGYLERYGSEKDRRIVVIRLTEKGATLVEEVKAMFAHYFTLVTEILTEEEAALLFHTFKKIVTHLGSKKGEVPEHSATEKIQSIPIE